MKRLWKFLINPFLVATRNNYLKVLKLSKFHLEALASKSGDPFFGPMYTAYVTIHLNYNLTYTAWTQQKSQQSGSTVTFDQLLAQLKQNKIKVWNVAVQNIFAHGTADYKVLFPHFRIPFQKGSQVSIMNEVSNLSLGLTAYPFYSLKKQ